MKQLSVLVTSLTDWFKFWWTCSRAYALPVTVMAWLTAFIFSIDGNIFNGILALIGIIFLHLATNIFDDYFDYKILSKDEKFMNSAQEFKCKFIKDGLISQKDLFTAGLICCEIACIIGAVLTYKVGYGVLLIAAIASVFVLFYSKCTMIGLGEFAVGIMYGPLLFEGVHFVMKSEFSFNIFLISLAMAPFIIAFLYTHTLLDYDGDKCSHKKTLACSFSKETSLKILMIIYGFGYLLISIYSIISRNYLVLSAFITLPLVIELYKTMKKYIEDKSYIPEVKWWNYPLGNWDYVVKEGSQGFYLRMYLSRNINTWFTLLVCSALLLDKIF